MKRILAVLIFLTAPLAANAADLIEWAPAPPVIFKDANRPCQTNNECEAKYCLADPETKSHGICRDRKFPGFGCLTLFDKDKGTYEYCAD